MLAFKTAATTTMRSCWRGERHQILLRRGLGGSSSSSSNKKINEKNNMKIMATPATAIQAMEPVYVHPLSQIVLLYLQDHCHDWIASKRVHALRVHRDGTFVLEFPPDDTASARIWTFYDPVDKKHWLAFSKHQVQHRFLLQDHLLPSWNGNKRSSLPERIQKSVAELIHAVDELDEEM